MATPVQGPTKPGAVPKDAPIVLAGLDSQGKVRALKTDALGLLAFSAVPDATAAAGDLTGTYPNPTIAAGKVTLAKMVGTFAYLKVQTGAPTTLTSPLVYDDTAVTGGLHAWNGTAYVKIAGLVS